MAPLPSPSRSIAASECSTVKAFSGLKSATLSSAKSYTSMSSVQNGSLVQCMLGPNPISNLKFETFGYLPALSEEDIVKQVDYMIREKLIPCLEFGPVGVISRTNNRSCGY
ncbi:hypothetical protein M758_6G166700 [Ceratodon purpureus]|nr:hypothetical protein M758_6G166700 [Ceratodon purpureus]